MRHSRKDTSQATGPLAAHPIVADVIPMGARPVIETG
jgi:hypothetical protein